MRRRRVRVEGFVDEHLFGRQIPVMQNVSHQDHIGGGKLLLEKIPGVKSESIGDAVAFGVFVKYWCHLGQIEANATHVRIREQNLYCQVALCGADVDERPVIPPWEPPGAGHIAVRNSVNRPGLL